MRLNIEIDSTDPRFAAVVTALAGGAAPKAQDKSASAPVTKTKTDEPVEEKTTKPSPDVPSVDDAKKAGQAFASSHTREALIELLGEFGVKQIGQLDDDQRVKFIERCTA